MNEMQFSCIWVCLRKLHLHHSDLLVTHTSGPHSCSLALAVSIKYVDLDWNDKCITAVFFFGCKLSNASRSIRPADYIISMEHILEITEIVNLE